MENIYESRKLYRKARNEYDDCLYEDAFDLANQALRLWKENWRAYQLLTLIQMRQKAYKKALKLIRKSISLKKSSSNLRTLGILMGMLNKSEEELHCLKASLKIGRNNSKTWKELGCYYHSKKLYGSAIFCFEKSLSLDPSFKVPCLKLAFCYGELYQFEQSMEYLQRLKSLVEQDSDIDEENNYQKLLDEMISVTQSAINEVDDQRLRSMQLLQMARNLCQERRFLHALEIAKKAKEVDPDYFIAFGFYANLLFCLRQYEECRKVCEDAKSIFEDKGFLWLVYAKTLRALGYRDEALEAIKKSVNLVPYWEAYQVKADLISTPVKMHNAKKALKLNKQDYYSMYIIGKRLYEQGNYDDAMDMLKKATQINPHFEQAQFYRALIWDRLNYRATANAFYEDKINVTDWDV